MPDHQPTADVFDLDRPVASPLDVAEVDDEQDEPVAASKNGIPKGVLSLLRGALGCALLLVFAYLLFPEIFRFGGTDAGLQPASTPANSSVALTPQAAIQEDALRREQEIQSAPIVERVSKAPSRQDSAITPEPSASVALADQEERKAILSAVNAINANQHELSRRLDGINLRISAIAAQASDNSAPDSKTSSAEKTVDPELYKAYRVRTNPAGPSLSGYELNTLYRGVAWIRYGDLIYSVREGDTLGDLTIKSINVQQRLVRTSRGIIR